MTDIELKELVASLAVRQAETDRLIKELGQETRELGKQIGGLGEKFGGFTEGMAYPSMQKFLRERFGMDVISPRVSSRRNGHTMEVDVLAYSETGSDEVYLVEVKSHLREDGLEQMLRMLKGFHDFFPSHAGKKVYGILAAVDIPEDIAQKVLAAGIYLARIHDGNFQLQVPEGFQPRAF